MFLAPVTVNLPILFRINARLGGENSIAGSKALSELQKARFMVVGKYMFHLFNGYDPECQIFQVRMSDTQEQE